MKELKADEVKVGHCIIINHFDQPCTRLVAVVKDVKLEMVVANYLSDDLMCRSCWSARPSDIMPVNRFGVRVFLHDDGDYSCLRDTMMDVTAVYPDGVKRQWQKRTGLTRMKMRDNLIIFYCKGGG